MKYQFSQRCQLDGIVQDLPDWILAFIMEDREVIY